MRTVLDLKDLADLHMIPRKWEYDSGWAPPLMRLSQMVLEQDSLYQIIATYVLDPRRERWVPRSRRAA